MTISDPEMQLNALKAAWNLIDGETYVDTANEISGLEMKYSASAEQANKAPPPGAGAPGGDPMGGDDGSDPNSSSNADTGATPGQFDDGSQGSMQPPPKNQNQGTPRVGVGMQGDPNAGAELGDAPSSGASYKIEKSERLSPTDIVRL